MNLSRPALLQLPDRLMASGSSGTRGFGAAATAFVLIGASVMAPFSTSAAFAAGDEAVFGQRNEQAFVSALSTQRPVDLAIDATDTAPAGSAGTGASAGTSAAPTASAAEYTLDQFMSSGVVNWGGYKFTYYSEQVLPGPGLEIPGRHVSDAGYVTDADGYIVLAGSADKGTVYDTPFGAQGKIYDRGTAGNHLDVYIR